MNINEGLHLLKEGMVYSQLGEGVCRVGVNFYMDGPIVAPEGEMKSIYMREILEGLYGDIQHRLHDIHTMMQTDVVAADASLRLLIHDMRF